MEENLFANGAGIGKGYCVVSEKLTVHIPVLQSLRICSMLCGACSLDTIPGNTNTVKKGHKPNQWIRK